MATGQRIAPALVSEGNVPAILRVGTMPFSNSAENPEVRACSTRKAYLTAARSRSVTRTRSNIGASISVSRRTNSNESSKKWAMPQPRSASSFSSRTCQASRAL